MFSVIVLPEAMVVAAGNVHVNPVMEHDDELKSTAPLKPSSDVITSGIAPELVALASVTFGFGDHTVRPGAVGQSLVSSFTFTEPRPVAKSYPVPALKARSPLLFVSTPYVSPLAVEQSVEFFTQGTEFVPTVTS
jgi:hypothetical protein